MRLSSGDATFTRRDGQVVRQRSQVLDRVVAAERELEAVPALLGAVAGARRCSRRARAPGSRPDEVRGELVANAGDAAPSTRPSGPPSVKMTFASPSTFGWIRPAAGRRRPRRPATFAVGFMRAIADRLARSRASPVTTTWDVVSGVSSNTISAGRTSRAATFAPAGSASALLCGRPRAESSSGRARRPICAAGALDRRRRELAHRGCRRWRRVVAAAP